MRQKDKNMLATWQGIIDVTAEYSASCDNCKSERGSNFEWYTKIFAKAIPTDIPVIEFPKWPDIVLDFSQVEAGIRIMARYYFCSAADSSSITSPCEISDD